MTGTNPEIGRRIVVNGLETNYHDLGSGFPLLMIHGSGPGVSGYANWRPVMGALAESRRVIVPDMAGFGFSAPTPGQHYGLPLWVSQIIGLLDSLGVEQVDLVGNSFGGAIALQLAIRHPGRVRRLVLMGSAGVHFELTEGLDAVWGYQPSVEAMRGLLDIFAHDRARVTDELAQLRFAASVRPGVQEAFSAMFPPPRQRWVDALASDESRIAALPHETLILHGREDRVVPLAASLRLAQLVPRAQLHVFGQCGHWTQIEQAGRFVRLLDDFLDEAPLQKTTTVETH